MPFISYAQNFEDVMLHRAFRHIERGFYIDVGAFDPTQDSVTKAFYDRGWNGINIEPLPQCHARFVAERPRDINLRIAASDTNGISPYFEVRDTGLSTLDTGIAHGHELAGRSVTSSKVNVATLNMILADHAVVVCHFLKIDVEGAEDKVLAGLSLVACRPWIIVVEATLPGKPTPCHQNWEPALLNCGYRFAYFDGLNRFYLAEEHEELFENFASPPNVFDEIVRVEEMLLRKQVQDLSVALSKQQHGKKPPWSRKLAKSFRQVSKEMGRFGRRVRYWPG